jgi:hypothetical protein
MFETLSSALALTKSDIITLALICFAAGLVRGFSGFALSAVAMASAASFIPPVELIPLCWWLEISATTMRATVILFLLLSSGLSVANYFLFDVMTQIAVFRGIFFIVPAIIGVHLGTKFFIPKWEHFYRPFCLTLLIILSGAGLVRLIA